MPFGGAVSDDSSSPGALTPLAPPSPVPFGGAVSDDTLPSSMTSKKIKAGHQCLSAERSATTTVLPSKLLTSAAVTSAFRRSGQRRRPGQGEGPRQGEGVTSAFRRSGQRRRAFLLFIEETERFVTSAFRRSGQRRQRLLAKEAKKAAKKSPVPFGGAVSDDLLGRS